MGDGVMGEWGKGWACNWRGSVGEERIRLPNRNGKEDACPRLIHFLPREGRAYFFVGLVTGARVDAAHQQAEGLVVGPQAEPLQDRVPDA
jgi:hypothetical protein